MGKETAGGVMTKLTERNTIILTASNRDVHDECCQPVGSPHSVNVSFVALSITVMRLARSQHACLRPPVVGSFFLHLSAVDSLDVLTLRNSFVGKKRGLKSTHVASVCCRVVGIPRRINILDHRNCSRSKQEQGGGKATKGTTVTGLGWLSSGKQ